MMNPIFSVTKSLFKDPIGAARTPSQLSIIQCVIIQTIFAQISGAIVALINQSVLDFFIALIMFPIASVLISAGLTLFMYYFFMTLDRVHLDIQRAHALVVVATLPYFVLHAFAGFLAPIDLIGFAAMMIMLTVGLTEQFGIARSRVYRFTGALFGLFFLVWSITQFAIS